MLARLRLAVVSLPPREAAAVVAIGTFVSLIAALALLWWFRRRRR